MAKASRELFMEEADTEIRSRFYDSAGNTLDYTYEPLEEDTVKIWAGAKGSPAHAVSKMSKDGKTLSAEWGYPGEAAIRPKAPGCLRMECAASRY